MSKQNHAARMATKPSPSSSIRIVVGNKDGSQSIISHDPLHYRRTDKPRKETTPTGLGQKGRERVVNHIVGILSEAG